MLRLLHFSCCRPTGLRRCFSRSVSLGLRNRVRLGGEHRPDIGFVRGEHPGPGIRFISVRGAFAQSGPQNADPSTVRFLDEIRQEAGREFAESDRKRVLMDWKLCSAASLPERFVLDRTRPVWEPLMMREREDYELLLSLVCRELRDAGPPGRAALYRIHQVMRELHVTRESLAAARRLRGAIRASRCECGVEYRSAEEARAEVLAVSQQDYRLYFEQHQHVADVDVWFPAYQRAWQYIAEHGCGLKLDSPEATFDANSIYSWLNRATCSSDRDGSHGDASEARDGRDEDASAPRPVTVPAGRTQSGGAVVADCDDTTARHSAVALTVIGDEIREATVSVTDDDIREMLLIAEDAAEEWRELDRDREAEDSHVQDSAESCTSLLSDDESGDRAGHTAAIRYRFARALQRGLRSPRGGCGAHGRRA